MGMNPYINASIIMQLMTVVSERIKDISKEGEMGRRRITRYTRILTVALATGAVEAHLDRLRVAVTDVVAAAVRDAVTSSDDGTR